MGPILHNTRALIQTDRLLNHDLPLFDNTPESSGLFAYTETLFLRSQNGFHFSKRGADFIGKRLECRLDLGGEGGGCVLQEGELSIRRGLE